MRTLLALAPLALTVAASAQTTWYVDAVAGSDTNLGTARSSPFRSISFAVTLAADDDRILVLPGTYSSSATGEVFPIAVGAAGSQRRIRLIGEEGADRTIIDMEQQSISAVTPILRFLWDAEGTSVTGFTFTNTGTSSFWSMAIRCGSTSGANFATRDIEIYGNRFTNCRRAIVVFGTEPANLPNQTTGIRFHDNLLDGNSNRAVAMWGPGQNACYNNTIVGSGNDGIWVDSLSSQPPSQTLIANNIVVGSQVGGIAAGPQGASATVVNNIAFQNAGGEFIGFTADPSNLAVDPLFVGPGDFRLQPGSPALETGTLAGLAPVRLDYANYSRISDSDGDGATGIDRGCLQRTDQTMLLTGSWGAIGQTVTFDFQASPPGAGLLAFSAGAGALPLLNFGIYALDPSLSLFSLSIGTVPAQFPLPLPNDPSLSGATIHMQGAYVGAPGVRLLNAYERTF